MRRRRHRDSGPVQRLAEIPLFNACGRRDLTILASLLDLTDAPAGTVLHEQGAMCKWWYAIRSGNAAVMKDGETVGTIGRGDWWGEGTMLGKRCLPVSIVALTTMSLSVVNRRGFEVMLHRVPTVLDRLMKELATRPAPWETTVDYVSPPPGSSPAMLAINRLR